MTGTLLGHSSANSTISVEAPKPLSSNIDSKYVLPTKKLSFASSNFYPPMSSKSPSLFVVGSITRL